MMRSVPFEYRAEVLESIYGKPGGEETEAVGNVEVEKTVMEQLREMRDRHEARRQSRTEPDVEN